MRTTRYLLLTLLMALFAISAEAQQRNVLQLPDISTQVGNIQLPINIENTDEIAGVQFDITLPEGITAEPNGVPTNRSNNHTITVSRLSNGAYRVLLHSLQNAPLRGQSGTVMYLPINIPTTYEEGSQHPVQIDNAVLGKATGENVLTESISGSIYISKLPDLTVKNITCDKDDINPGEHIIVSWQVENIGELATGGGWSEQISLVSKDGTQNKLIATTHYDNVLNANDIVSRQVEINLPTLLGIDGDANLQVCIIPDSNAGEAPSAQKNNTQAGDYTLHINKILTFVLSPLRIDENSAASIAVKLNRSGYWAKEQTFAIASTADPRVTIPESITIPAGQSGKIIYLKVTDNEILDTDSIVNLTISGNDYTAVSQQLVIEDNEYPDLALEASKSVITEGEVFQLTVTTNRAGATPITVTLSSENSKQFSFPATITIPAGETSATVDVSTTDDELPNLEFSNAFTASAPKHNKAETIVLLQDNDLPVLTLELTPNKVQESAGVIAVAGVLRRTGNTDNKITVHITDDSNGGIYYGNNRLILDKGVEEIHFNFGPINNAQVDGDRTNTITAAVWISSCSCSVAGESTGAVQAQLTILDDDGPALNLTSSLSTVKEGDKTMLTITRNTTTDTDLAVTLQSDNDNEITYNSSVIIPTGQTATTVEVVSKSNETQGDSHLVVFTAQADGYSTGTCYVMITDQTQPDARISSLVADDTEAVVGNEVKLNIEISNSGAAPLPADIPVKIYRRGSNAAIGTVYTNEAIAVGGSLTISKTITLPTTVGNHNYYAVVNESNVVQELTYTNNTSADATIAAIAPYSATVSTDKAIYKQGEKVIITGELAGNGITETEIDLYIMNEGVRQVQTVKTDTNGAFTYEWQPYALMSGHFAVGACYPGEGLKTEMATFDVYGLRRTEYSNIICDITNGDTHNGHFNIINPGSLGLTDVRVELLQVPTTCEATINIPSKIAANETAKVEYTLKAISPTIEHNWEEIKARITSAEGVSLDVTLYFCSRTAQGKLMSNTNSIVTTISKGKSREYAIEVTNIGRGNTGKITLALPYFIESLSGNTLPALEQNGTQRIVLSITPTETMQLNVPITGQIGINCENGDGTPICFTITPVSDEVGTLLVDVCDEYTYYTNEAPHVKGAEVVVKNPTTNATISQGYTNDNGLFSIELPEGYYKLCVTANNHDSYTNNVYVDPATETSKVVNLSTQAISVDWKVEETEVEDEYEIITTVEYETNVPTPVVELIVPKSLPVDELGVGESLIFHAILTNKGLITALDAELILPEGFKRIKFEPLAQYTGLNIAPQESVSIPVKVTRVTSPSYSKGSGRSNMDDDPCVGQPGTLYFWDCGLDRKWHRYGIAMQLGSCKSNDPSTWEPSRNYPEIETGGSRPGSWWHSPNGSVYAPSLNTPTISVKDEGCEPCQNGILLAGLKCAQHFLGEAKETLQTLMGLSKEGDSTSEQPSGFDIANSCYELLSSVAGTFDACVNVSANFDDVHNCYSSASKTIDKMFDEALTAALGNFVPPSTLAKYKSMGKKMLKYKSWIDKAADCAKEFVHACDHIKDTTEYADPARYARIKANTTVDYTNSVLNNLELIGAHMEAFGYINDIMWGDEDEWNDVSYAEMSILLDSINYIEQDFDDIVQYKPEALSMGQFRKYFERKKEFFLVGMPDSISKKVEKCIEIMQNTEDYFLDLGYLSTSDYAKEHVSNLMEIANEKQSAVCSSITLQFKQTMTMTRQAFRGSLIVFNGHESLPMENVRLNLEVSNKSTGELATAQEFQLNAESLDGFTGEINLSSGWTLGANATGTATVLFIPTKYAAPDEPVEWSFGGTLTYIDPFTGLEVTRALYPVTLTVKPSPILDLTYFMQRDIYGDDPLTSNIVEPMAPAEFALIINNKGNGDASNVRMVTQQPQIIDNEKGLYINFELIKSQVNGGEAALSFGQSIANEFGTIPANSQMYAQWWLTSSLLGHFTDYDVEATHVTSYGNEDLSLLDNVTIHELIHGFTAGTNGDVPVRGFLVNEITDKYDTPDQVYFSDATQQDVATNANITIGKQSDTEYLLTVNASSAGWYYGSILDPTNGKQNLVSVVRESDGLTLPTDNIWQTDRTLCDGRDWLYENRLHFVGEINNGNESYLLTFEPKPEIELEVESIIGIPEEGTVLKEQLAQATVKFNVPIKPETFTAEDLTLTCQGAQQDVTNIQITQVSETEFTLNLSAITLKSGYYMLTVQTATIEDTEGFNGSAGKQVGWIQFIDGKVALSVTVSPTEGGSVTPTGGSFDYDSDVTLKATAAEGYDFTGWTLNGENVSQESEYTHHLTTDTDLSAHFTIKHYYVTIGCDATQGAVAGAATGIYDHGTVLELLATPATGYEFDYWALNEERDINNPYSLIVNRDITIDAQFKEQITTGIQDAEEEALNVSITPLPLQEHIYINGNFNEIEYVNIYSMNGSKVVGAYNVQPQEEIYVGMLQAGIYFIVVETDRGVFRTKVIKR